MNSRNLRDAVGGLLDRLNGVERAITCAAFLVLVIAVFADVLSRELIGTGLHWARQTGVYANVVVVMFGLGLASASGSHLRPRFADRWLPERVEPLLMRVNDLGMALFCLVFAWIAAGVVADSIALGERSVALRVAVWPFQSVVPLAFGVAGVRHLAYAALPDLRPAEAGALAVTSEEPGGG